MIRRVPTRIEMKLDDLSEYNVVRREYEAMKAQRAAAQTGPIWNLPAKSKQEIINERIGYVPQSKPPTYI